MRRVVSGEFELKSSAADAIGLFTPEGERAWGPGWNPIYPSGEVSESSGTVFTTDVGGVVTIWLIQMIDRDECSAAYLRVTPGHHAGTVKVDCGDGADGNCVVSVTYDMSLLPGSDPAALDAYNDVSFQSTMNDWATRASQALGH